jgi:prepilin-type N-terminal cleavage/methylation domain-containing protein
MDRRGFSLIELLIVIVIIGAVASFAFPMIRKGMEARRVSGARIAITTLNAKARALAVQRSRVVRLILNGNTISLESTHPVTGAVQTVDRRNLYDVYGVSVTSTRDTLIYDPRGLGRQGSITTITVTRPGGYADTVAITPLGGVQ